MERALYLTPFSSAALDEVTGNLVAPDRLSSALCTLKCEKDLETIDLLRTALLLS